MEQKTLSLFEASLRPNLLMYLSFQSDMSIQTDTGGNKLKDRGILKMETPWIETKYLSLILSFLTLRKLFQLIAVGRENQSQYPSLTKPTSAL